MRINVLPDIMGDSESEASTESARDALVNDLINAYLVRDDCPLDYLAFDEPFITTNGVDMGNPGTKGLLTLMSLMAEFEATELCSETQMNLDFIDDEPAGFWFRKLTNNIVVNSYDMEDDTHALLYGRAFKNYDKGYNVSNVKVKPPSIFSTAGDDQVNVGTREKLSLVSMCHRTNHMKISEEKDLVSPLGLIYCERLALRTPHNSFSSSVNDTYEKHMMVDSLKMRLFSPMSKAQESSDEPNPAIGKARALSTLKTQLPADWQNFADIVVNLRFKQRMFHYLPRTKSGSIDPVVDLPHGFGGLGLCATRKEMEIASSSISDDHVSLICILLNGDEDRRIKRALPSLMKDRFARGVKFDENVVDTLFQNLVEYLEPVPKGLYETMQSARAQDATIGEAIGYDAKRRKLNQLGYVGSREIQQLYKRSLLQERLLCTDPTKGWSQSDWPRRRSVYERTLTELLKLKATEGVHLNYEEGQILVSREQVSALYGKSQRDYQKFTFIEDIFYHRDMKVIDYETLFVNHSYEPVSEILDSLTRLELPPIGEWFPQTEPTQ